MKSRAMAIANSPASAMRALAFLVLGLALVLAQAMVAQARGATESFADLAEKVSPAVVNITTSTTVTASGAPRLQVPEGSPFEDLFRDFQDRQPGQGGPRRASALGSGFIISEDGYIVTNNHVIEDADDVMVELYSGGELRAKVIGTDPKTDIALLKVETDEPLPFVRFGDSDIARVGDWVLAVGNPLGQGFSVSAGIISARNRALRGTYDDFIQTDAAINRGNSGGPLFNMDGDVIGVNTAILSPNGGGSIGIGFSMSSAVVSKVVDQLRQYGETRRGWLGVRIQDVTKEDAEALNLGDVAGALVADVPPGPAADAGMQAGDVIVTFDGKHVPDTRELVRMVGEAEVGKSVRVVVFRDGKTVTLKVMLGRREDAEGESVVPAVAAPEDRGTREMLGLTLQPLNTELRDQLGLSADDSGVVVMRVDETSQAYEKGLRPGDVITEAGQQRVASLADLDKRVAQAREGGRKSILLLIRRGGEPRFVALSLDG
ncbi:MAG: Do family serine endopeptidase [Rhodobacteraceae bacterium]|nr:Do family serine endopeptidase [Paracoccaceae bacterium]